MVLDKEGFNRWAGEYDQSIDPGDREYPFAGYYELLALVQDLVLSEGYPSVLDLGVGTGLLSAQLYGQGCRISGVDFSEEMLALARLKMPEAKFYQYDFSRGLPPVLEGKGFDYIVSSYAFHHLPLADQAAFMVRLVRENLNPGGSLIVADVAFATWEEFRACRAGAGKYWDGEEAYLVLEAVRPALTEAGLDFKYTQVSHCGGVLEVSR